MIFRLQWFYYRMLNKTTTWLELQEARLRGDERRIRELKLTLKHL